MVGERGDDGNNDWHQYEAMCNAVPAAEMVHKSINQTARVSREHTACRHATKQLHRNGCARPLLPDDAQEALEEGAENVGARERQRNQRQQCCEATFQHLEPSRGVHDTA